VAAATAKNATDIINEKPLLSKIIKTTILQAEHVAFFKLKHQNRPTKTSPQRKKEREQKEKSIMNSCRQGDANAFGKI
jgi:hypothetical protein